MRAGVVEVEGDMEDMGEGLFDGFAAVGLDEEQEEGQLSVDVYQEGDTVVVKSTIAGIEPEDVDISLTNDMLTIRGERKRDSEALQQAFAILRRLVADGASDWSHRWDPVI